MKAISYILRVAPDMAALIEGLAKHSKCDRSEVFRRAILLLDLAVTARENGKFVGVADNEEKLTNIVDGL